MPPAEGIGQRSKKRFAELIKGSLARVSRPAQTGKGVNDMSPKNMIELVGGGTPQRR